MCSSDLLHWCPHVSRLSPGSDSPLLSWQNQSRHPPQLSSLWCPETAIRRCLWSPCLSLTYSRKAKALSHRIPLPLPQGFCLPHSGDLLFLPYLLALPLLPGLPLFIFTWVSQKEHGLSSLPSKPVTFQGISLPTLH